MKKIGLLLIPVGFLLLSPRPALADTVYVSAQTGANVGGLYTFDTATNTLALDVLTNSATTGANVPLYDIAMNSSGQMFGVDQNGQFYSVNIATGALTTIGASTLSTVGGSGFPGNALTFDRANGTLWVAGGNTVGTVNTSTGSFSAVGSSVYNSSGDLEFAGGTLYLTSKVTPSTDSLYSIDTTTGAGTSFGITSGWAHIDGMAFDTNNSTMYGFDRSGDVLTIALTNPNSTTLLVGGTGVQFLGATMQTAATPEPAALSLFGSGLLLMSMIHVRRKRNFRSSPAA